MYESLARALFTNKREQFSYKSCLHVQYALQLIVSCPILYIYFLCVLHRESDPPPSPCPPTPTVNLASDWLDFDLEVRRLCYWPTP
jgi:hypothetical protein